MDFTSWDAGLHTRDSNYLEQHGIPGMKWGVRRYQNRDGSLTPAGEKHYGSSGNGRSARRMTKDFNRLDKGYANAEHRRLAYQNKVVREMRKANRGSNSQERVNRHKQKALDAAKKASEANKQKKAIEALQWKIIGKAAKKGYTVNSQSVVRSGKRARTRLANALTGIDFSTKVHGQNVSIKRFGSGQTNVVNYAGLAEAERRRRKAANMQAIAGAYR